MGIGNIAEKGEVDADETRRIQHAANSENIRTPIVPKVSIFWLDMNDVRCIMYRKVLKRRNNRSWPNLVDDLPSLKLIHRPRTEGGLN